MTVQYAGPWTSIMTSPEFDGNFFVSDQWVACNSRNTFSTQFWVSHNYCPRTLIFIMTVRFVKKVENLNSGL